MHPGNRTSLTIVLATSMLLLLSCGIGPIFAPTPTPTLTNTPIPSSTPTLTATPTQIPTATPNPSPTPQSYAIQDSAFEGEKQSCNTDVDINSVNGDSFGVTARTISMINGGWAIFCWGARHTWMGTLTYSGYTFASDTNDPLQFQVDQNKGYVYIHGSGTVTEPDMTAVALGSAAGPADNTQSAQNNPASPVTVAGGAVLFQDTFNSNANDWETGSQSDSYGTLNRQIVNGKYRFDVTSKQDYFFVLAPVPDFSGKDFIFSIDATIVDINATPGDLEFGFAIREAEGIDGKRYEFMVYNDNTYEVTVWPNSDYTNVKEIASGDLGTANLEKGVTNTYTLEANGPTFTFYVNGDKIDSFTDATINEAGSMSLWLGLDKANQSVNMEFDNLTIKKIP